MLSCYTVPAPGLTRRARTGTRRRLRAGLAYRTPVGETSRRRFIGTAAAAANLRQHPRVVFFSDYREF